MNRFSKDSVFRIYIKIALFSMMVPERIFFGISLSAFSFSIGFATARIYFQ